MAPVGILDKGFAVFSVFRYLAFSGIWRFPAVGVSRQLAFPAVALKLLFYSNLLLFFFISGSSVDFAIVVKLLLCFALLFTYPVMLFPVVKLVEANAEERLLTLLYSARVIATTEVRIQDMRRVLAILVAFLSLYRFLNGIVL